MDPIKDELESFSPDAILFGGTFDPPHFGHEACALALLEEFPKARLLILPTPYPPSTDGKMKAVQTSYQDRFQLSVDFFKPFLAEHPLAELSDYQNTLPPPHYTSELLLAYQKAHPGEKVVFAMGEDQFAQIHRWHAPHVVLGFGMIVLHREQNRPWDEGIRSLGYKENTVKGPLSLWTHQWRDSQALVYRISRTNVRISSRDIRELIRKKTPPAWIDKKTQSFYEDWALPAFL